MERHNLNGDGAGDGIGHLVGLAPRIREPQGTPMTTAVMAVLNRQYLRILGNREPKVLTEVTNHRRVLGMNS